MTRPRSDHLYHPLHCLDAEGGRLSCTVGWADGPERDVRVSVPDRGLHLSAQGFDLFEAFLEMRRQLEGKGLLLVCAGARLDCWPTGMSRGMGAGETAYLLTPGRPPEIEDLVYLFAPAEGGAVGTVEAQGAAFRRWLDTLPEDDEDDDDR